MTEEHYEKEIGRLRTALEEADAVVIGAGAGLSTSAGFTYAGERFRAHFSDFAAKYDFSDMYSGGFYPYETLEEYWAYWSRYIYINRYMDAPKPVYEKLLELVRDKDYFVLITVSRRQDLIRNDCFIHRGTMDFFSAASRTVRKLMIMKSSSVRWYSSRKI